jgi:hypothetical protein
VSVPFSVPWSEFTQDPRRPESRPMRASDRDRDIVLQVLADGFADGRLDRAEYDERAEVAGRARTLGELPPLIGDLVPSAPTARRDLTLASPADLQAMALEEYERSRRHALSSVLGTAAVLTVIWAVTGHGFYWPVFVILVTAVNLLRMVLAKKDLVAEELRKLERKQQRAIEGHEG